jgi:hypothetical protein
MPDDTHFPLREDRNFQGITWTAQRIAWVIFLIIPLLALTGLFSGGALSSRTGGNGQSFSIDYDAFQRVTALTHFVVHLPQAQNAELRLGPRFQQDYEIESVAPQPAKSAAGGDGLHLTFDRSGGPLDAVIWARPRRFGAIRFAAQGAGEAVTLNILVYP